MAFGRRDFLRGGLGVAATAPTMAVAVQALLARSAGAQSGGTGGAIGRLSPKPDLRDGRVRLTLPDGWTYRSFGATGDGSCWPLSEALRPRRCIQPRNFERLAKPFPTGRFDMGQRWVAQEDA